MPTHLQGVIFRHPEC